MPTDPVATRPPAREVLERRTATGVVMLPPGAPDPVVLRGDPTPITRHAVAPAALTTAQTAAAPADLPAHVVASGLPGAAPLPAGVASDECWQHLLGEVVRQRVAGHLVAAVERGDLAVTVAQRSEAIAAHERSLALDLLLERLLLDTVDALGLRGIECRVLKGAALAHLAYDDAALRSSGDVDVLVRSADFDRAATVLESTGCARRFTEPRPGFAARFGKAVCFVTPDGFEVDLHRTLADGPYGAVIDADALFDRPAPFVVAGSTLSALPADLAFLHACVHASLGDTHPRLVSLRDVAQLATSPDVEWERVRSAASRWECTAVLQRAVERAEATLGIDLRSSVPDWLVLHAPTRFERWAMRSYTAGDRSYPGQVVAAFWSQRGLANRFAYARAMLLPDRAYLADRERRYLRRAANGLRLLVRWRPR